MSLFGFIPFVFVLTVARSAVAQAGGSTSTVMLDLGGLYAQQRARAAIGAGTLSLEARRATLSSVLSASGLLLRSADSSTAMQGTLSAELAWPKQPSLRVEFSGTATRFGALATEDGVSRDGYIRPQIVRANYGVFGTLGAGTVTRQAVGQHGLAWDVGSWARRGRLTGALTLRRSFTNDSLLMEASNITLSRAAHHYALQDVQATVAARVSRFELLTRITSRHGLGATTGSDRALFASLATNLSSRLLLVLNGGQQLAEPLSGIPAAKIFGASLRVFVLGRATGIAPKSSVAATTQTSEFATRITRHATGGATVTVRVDAPASAQVELAGSFNDWTNLSMTRKGNAFELTIQLPSGTHRLAVRVNGGGWQAPNGLARVKDELGGEAGIVVVP